MTDPVTLLKNLFFAPRASYFTAAGRFHKLVVPGGWSKKAEDELRARLLLTFTMGGAVVLPTDVRLYAMGAPVEKMGPTVAEGPPAKR